MIGTDQNVLKSLYLPSEKQISQLKITESLVLRYLTLVEAFMLWLGSLCTLTEQANTLCFQACCAELLLIVPISSSSR